MLRKAVFTLLTLTLIALPAAAELSLDEILATNLESKGGKESLDALKSVQIEGRLSIQPGMEAPITIQMKRPNHFRMEFSLQGMTGIQAFDGETGWQVMPFGGSSEPEKMTGEDLEGMMEQADFDGPLINYKEKGHKVELLGTEEVDGTEAYKLKLTLSNGSESTLFLDTEYCLEMKTVSKREVQGMSIEVEQVLGDYKEVAGTMMAHSMTQKMQGQPGPSLTFETVTANVEIDGDRFAMPAVEEKAEGDEVKEEAGE